MAFFDFLTKEHPNYYEFSVTSINKFFDINRQEIKKQISHLFNKLFRYLERWLTINELYKNPLLVDYLSVRAYASYAPTDYFNRHAIHTKNKIAKSKVGFLATSYTKFAITQSFFHYPFTLRYQIKHPLKQLSTYLDDYYVAQKLSLICQQLSISRFMKENSGLYLEEEIIKYAEQYPANEYFQLYLKLYAIIKKHDNQLLTEIITQFPNKMECFDRLGAAIYWYILLTHVAQLTNARQATHLQIQFDMYKLAIEKDLVIFDNGISNSFFYNVVQAACHVKAFTFAKAFIDNYHSFLENGKDSILPSFTKGFIYFHQKKFNEAYDLLTNITFKDHQFKLISRVLKLKCLYELSCQETTYIQVTINDTRSFQKFIERNSIFSIKKKQLYLAFCKEVLNLIKLRKAPQSTRYKRKQELILKFNEETTQVSSLNWLLEKANLI